MMSEEDLRHVQSIHGKLNEFIDLLNKAESEEQLLKLAEMMSWYERMFPEERLHTYRMMSDEARERVRQAHILYLDQLLMAS